MPEYEVTVLDRETFERRDPLIVDAANEELAVKQVDHDQFIVTGVRVYVPQPPPSPPMPEPPPDEWLESFAWLITFVGGMYFLYTLSYIAIIHKSVDGWSLANVFSSGFVISLILFALGAMLGWMGRTSRRLQEIQETAKSASPTNGQ